MEKLFTRSQQRSLDAKGRLMLPPEYREGLSRNNEQGSFWLTCYYGRLVAYLPKAWDDFVEKLNNIGNPSLNIVRFKSKVWPRNCPAISRAACAFRSRSSPQPA